MSDHGGSHIAFYVEDMDAALSHLRSHKVRVLGVGKKACFGLEAGEESTFAHFLTPLRHRSPGKAIGTRRSVYLVSRPRVSESRSGGGLGCAGRRS
jgi:hypothetical protein